MHNEWDLKKVKQKCNAMEEKKCHGGRMQHKHASECTNRASRHDKDDVKSCKEKEEKRKLCPRKKEKAEGRNKQ